ncbi:MAG: xylan 1,4-beta-xylosidase [Acidobacteriota bacterium]|jgi:beta-xylosidase
MKPNPQIRRQLRTPIITALLIACSLGANAQRRSTYENPALAGDYPDPSIIRVGANYWAVTTSSEWAPEFPILASRDLVNWKFVGAVFQNRPAWSTGNYWAPEISYYRGKYFVYYVGHKNDGPLCVAVATSNGAAGPYQDHGPLVCQDAGSIDPVAVTDEHGVRYLLWKEDGNSRNQPTPIWAQQLSPDGTKLIGERRELIRNDAPWESQLVEGPFVLRRGNWFYLFYSGNACCGRECNYALGVARSRSLLGPWEKHKANPILKGNDAWKCPGHGSIVTDQHGRTFLFYHAYNAKDFVYVGREAMLDEVTWNADGWPAINNGDGPSRRSASPMGVAERNAEYSFVDEFTGPELTAGWQWPQDNRPRARIEGGQLLLTANAAPASDAVGAILARSTTVGNYLATAEVATNLLQPGVVAGLAAIGDRENGLGIAIGAEGNVSVWKRQKNQHEIVTTITAPAKSASIWLRLSARDGHLFKFAISDNGRNWKDVGPELDGDYLPPWDRGVRVALTAGGTAGAPARFKSLRIVPVR